MADTTALTFTLSAIDAGVAAAFAKIDAALAATGASLAKVDTAAGGVQTSMGQVETAVTQTAAATEAATTKAVDWSATWAQVKTGLAAVGGVAAGLVTGLAALTMQVANNVEATDDWATRLGVSVDWMSKMQFAASTVGVDLDGVGMAMTHVSVALADAAGGGAEASAQFARLGVSVVDAAGNVREIDAVMPEVADALAGLGNDAERTELALGLLGRAGGALVPLLVGGSQGLADMAAQADALGVSVGEKLVADVRVFQDGLDGVKAALQGTANTVVAALLPSINALIPQVTEFVVGLKESQAVQQTLIPLLEGVGSALTVVIPILEIVEGLWMGINTAFNLVVSGFMEGVTDWVGGLATLTEAAASAARTLGFEGIASGLDTASTNLRTAQSEAQGLANAAAETAAAWWEGNTKIATSTAALVPPLSAAEAAAKATAAAAGAAAVAVSKQWTALGLAIPSAMAQASVKATEALGALVAGGTLSAMELTRAWEATKTALVAQYGYLPKEFAAVDSAILTGNTTLAQQLITNFQGSTARIVEDASQIGAAWTVLGLEMPAAMQKGLGEVQTALHTIATNALTPVAQIQKGYEDLRDRTLELYGTLPAGFAQIDAAIASGQGALVRTLVGQLQTGVDAQVATVPQLVSVWENGHLRIIESGARVPVAAQAANNQLIGQAADAAEAIVPPWQAAHDRITALQDETLALLGASARQRVADVGAAADAIGAKVVQVAQDLEARFVPLLDRIGQFATISTPWATTIDGISEQIRETLAKMTHVRGPGVWQMVPGYVEWQLAEYQEALIILYKKLADMKAMETPGFSTGGLVPGAGPPDSVLARVSPGEFLIPPRDVAGLMSMLSAALTPRRSADGDGGGRQAAGGGGSTVVNQAVHVHVTYAGVMNPTMMVKDLNGALQEALRRGDLKIPAPV